jgi:hypothetical protein
MSAPITPEEIEQLFAGRIEALDASAYAQGGLTPGWSRTPLIGSGDDAARGAGLAHLGFDVVCGPTRSMPDERIATDVEVDCLTEVTALFTYQLRTVSVVDQRADRQLAYAAARDVLGACVANDARVGIEDFEIEAIGLDAETKLLLVEVRMVFHHSLQM